MMRAGRRGGAAGLVLGLALAVLPQANAAWTSSVSGQHARARYAATFPGVCTAGSKTLTAIADTWIQSGTGHGTDIILKIGGSGTRVALIKFDLTDIPSGCVIKASPAPVLSLTLSATGGSNTFSVQRADAAWTESSTTVPANSATDATSFSVTSSTPVGTVRTSTMSLQYVVANGFVITSGQSTSADWASRDNTTLSKPRLTISYG